MTGSRVRRTWTTWAIGLVASVAIACAHHSAAHVAASAPTQSDRIHLTIVGTNDLHGWIDAHDPPSGVSQPILGGLDIFGGYLRILRQQRPDGVLLIDAGDLFQGTLVANLTEGAAVIRAYNALGYDASAIGNHEFDYGPEGEAVVATTPSEDPVGNLKKRIGEAHFPFLAGNIYLKQTGQPVGWPNAPQTTIVHRQGLSIGIIGLTTPTTPSVTLAQNVRTLDFKPLVETTVDLAAQLRANGAQVIVVTMHAGAGCPPGNVTQDLSGCEPGELFPYLDQLPPGTIDAVVSGHTHQQLAQFVHGIPAIQSKSYGQAFGMIELVIDRATGKVIPSETKISKPTDLCRRVFVSTRSCTDGSGPLQPPEFMTQVVEPDVNVAQVIDQDTAVVRARKNEKLGPQLDVAFTRSRSTESSLGDLVADIMKDSITGAQVAITNSGGLRADIDRGPVTYGRVFEALPFENHVAVLRLTGGQLLQLLGTGVNGNHGLIQVSGLKLQLVDPAAKPCNAGGSRLLTATLTDGTPIIPEQTYTVITNDFIAGGGDGFESLMHSLAPAASNVRVDLPPVREMVVSYFRFHPDLLGPPTATDPRVTMVTPQCAAPTTER